MNKIFYNLREMACFLTLALVTLSCSNDTITRALYISGVEHIPLLSFSVVENGDALGVSATSSELVKSDVEVSFAGVPKLVNDYNAKNATNYDAFPDDAFVLSEHTALIKKGTNRSNAIKLVIPNADRVEEGKNYLLPIRIISRDGDYPALHGSDVLYVIINRSIITKAPKFNGSNYLQVEFKDESKYKNMNQFTIEARVSMWEFPRYYGGNLMGILGFPEKRSAWLFVDGTPDRVGGVGNIPCFMIGADAWDIWMGKLNTAPRELNTWYHVAATFSNGTISLYIDGELIGQTAYEDSFSFDSKFCIGAAPGVQNGFFLKGSVCEARFWSRALSPSELRNPLHQCYVDPTSDKLEAYWRLNDGEDICTDFTGNGNNAVKKGSGELEWIEGVMCP